MTELNFPFELLSFNNFTEILYMPVVALACYPARGKIRLEDNFEVSKSYRLKLQSSLEYMVLNSPVS